jgi:hypothetical protein
MQFLYNFTEYACGAPFPFGICMMNLRELHATPIMFAILVMSKQRFFKIVCFRFPTNVPEKIEYIRF